tara:strand:+ start:723 stop:923 length:201 start_codon:yes stop_codon:yes gene_type:complete
MSEYRNMTRLACYVAPQNIAEYERDDIQMLVGEVGCEAAEDFYEMIGQIYGADVDQILNWISEMED